MHSIKQGKDTTFWSDQKSFYNFFVHLQVGTVSHEAKLNIYGLPFIRPMEKKPIVAGETLVVTCPVAGYPIDSIVWERDNRPLPINRKQKVFPNGTLIIENVERNSDQATYTCVAKNSEGYSARGSIEIQVMGKLERIIHYFDTFWGEASQIVCCTSEKKINAKLEKNQNWCFPQKPSFLISNDNNVIYLVKHNFKRGKFWIKIKKVKVVKVPSNHLPTQMRNKNTFYLAIKRCYSD